MNSHSVGVGKLTKDKSLVSILKQSRICFDQNKKSKVQKKNVNFDNMEQEYPYYVDQVLKDCSNQTKARTTLGNISNRILSKRQNQSETKLKKKSPIKTFLKSGRPSPILEVNELADSQVMEQKFQQIFFSLDTKKVGYIDKTNCNIEVLPDNLKYLLGGVVSKIKCQGIRLTKDKFIKQGKSYTTNMVQNQIELLLSSKLCKPKNNTNLLLKPHPKNTVTKSLCNSTAKFSSTHKPQSTRQSKVTQFSHLNKKRCSTISCSQPCQII